MRMGSHCFNYTVAVAMRVKQYDYDAWLAQGLRLVDYDFEREEYVLAEFEPPITSQQARLLSYSSIHDLTLQQKEIIWPGVTEK